MLDKIINSKARLAILSLLFNAKDKQFYAQEIINSTKLDPANIHKELDNLISVGILKTEDKDNRKFYLINKENDFYEALSKLFEKYLEKQNMDKWFLLEEMPRNNPSLGITYIDYDFNKKYLKENFGIDHVCKGLVIFENGYLKLYFIRQESVDMANDVLEKIIKDPGLGSRINQTVVKNTDDWSRLSTKIYSSNLMKLSNKELYDWYYEFYLKQKLSHSSGWPSNAVEFEGSMFSKQLINILTDRKEKLKLNFSVGEVFSALTTPIIESNAQKEYKDLVNILGKIRANEEVKDLFANSENRLIEDKLISEFMDFYKLVERHTKNYGWLSYQFEGPGWDNSYFIDILASLVRQDLNPEAILADIKNKEKATKEAQDKYIQEFKLSPYELDLFEVAKGFVYAKGYRKDYMFYALSAQEILFKEIGRRFYLSIRQVRYMYPEEFKEMLINNKVDPDELNRRYEFHVLYFGREGKKIFTGDKARKFLSKLDFIKEEIGEVQWLEGDTASPGKVRGVVSIINSAEDMKKMKDGNVLVSMATSPDLVPAIKKSVAIVTDMGGVTCHAAIISRELGMPCVTGTKIATKVLHDGDVVEVDASHGRVTIIEKR